MPTSRMADARKTSLQPRPCGIIRIAALCPLCRYRHNGHWTGAKARLDRDLTGRFGSQDYSREELRAELASLFVGTTPIVAQTKALAISATNSSRA